MVSSVVLDNGNGTTINISADFRLDVGDIVKFPAGTLKETDTQARPIILSGAPMLQWYGQDRQ